jgi:lipoprotein-anchoring transpeptidase ErfK/SrfK
MVMMAAAALAAGCAPAHPGGADGAPMEAFAGPGAVIPCRADSATPAARPLVEVAPGVPTPLARADSAPISLALNVPAFRLDVMEDGERTRSYAVAVGSIEYPTPRGQYAITRVEWNPWWIPPESDWARDEKPTPPGPANPMGRVKLHFRPTYYLHGTPSERSIGSAAPTAACGCGTRTR